MSSKVSQIIRRVSLHEELIARIRELIVNGELAPGTRIAEKVLCQRFGVSRTPLREVLKVLASEGLVELQPQRGAWVTQLTLADVAAMFPVIGALEALAGEIACQRITAQQYTELVKLHQAMETAYEQRDRSRYFDLNRRIHEGILDITDNPVLINTYRGLAGRIRNARYVAAMSESSWAKAVQEHRAILQALGDRDGSRLAQQLRQHLASKCETVKEAIKACAEKPHA